jgi:hypothetical protein
VKRYASHSLLLLLGRRSFGFWLVNIDWHKEIARTVMTMEPNLRIEILRNLGTIVMKLEREDRVAILDLICEYHPTLPEERSDFSERFEPYLNYLRTFEQFS